MAAYGLEFENFKQVKKDINLYDEDYDFGL